MKNISDKDFGSALRYLEAAAPIVKRNSSNLKEYNLGRMMLLLANKWKRKR